MRPIRSLRRDTTFPLAAFVFLLAFTGCGQDVASVAPEGPSSQTTAAAVEATGQSTSTTRHVETEKARENWPSWRGPLGTGVAPQAQPPTAWGERKNVRWKTPLPGHGHSTPVVWGDQVYVTAAIPVGEELIPPRHDNAPGSHDNLPIRHQQQFVVMSVNRQSGKIDWQQTVHEEIPSEGGHTTGSLASHSPVTDGEVVIAFFGSHGLFALDSSGTILWQKDFGQMHSKHGHGESSSPALHGNTVVVNWDHEGESFLAAFDRRTGKEIWKKDRDEVTSWSSPVIVVDEGRPQVIVSGTNFIRGYDLATGEVIWRCRGLSNNIVASPVIDGGIGYFANSYNTRNLLAIRFAGAKGDLTGSERVLWTRRRGTPYVPSPLLYEGVLYFLGHYQNVLTRIDAESNTDQPGPMRLHAIRDVYASPVGADGRVYIMGRDGTTVVLSHADKPKVLAVNRIADTVSASLALVDDEIFVRGENALYCIAIAADKSVEDE